ncbi:MAG: antibiotic biosynthesis monooxygenase [Chloroflexi bacterium]|nr:antibiotic biosynthesis monooxygenase [Chloroflexota bacterium]
MITVITHHYVIPEMTPRAGEQIKENGRVMRSYPGFISRQTLYAENDPNQITTVTTWRALEDYQRWSSRPRSQAQPDALAAPSMYSKPIEAIVFNVVAEL